MTKLLLIEDNPGDAYLVQKTLARAAETFVVEHVTKLADALTHPVSESFDVILVDLGLPDSCGLRTVTTLRQRLPRLPLIVLTGSKNPGLALQALDLGAQDFLTKDDIDPEGLRRSIHYAAQRQVVVHENFKLLQRLEENKDLLKRKNRRLTRLYQTAQQFVDNVSHEFRTPLTVVKEYSLLLRDGLAGAVNEEQRQMLNIVVDRADDLNTMVDDMLDTSKLEAGMLGAWRKPQSLVDVIRRVLPTLEHKARVRNVSLQTTLDEQSPPVYCDGEKIGRVIINLTVNAIKFCGRPGIVQLWAKVNPQAKETVIGVTDNGPGIAAEQLDAIFERFKQLETDVDRGTKGFGLGLNIAKGLVELNLSTMKVESVVGQGSTFSFAVPWADPVAVTERYLLQIVESSQKSVTVSLVTIDVEESADDRRCDEVDAFLSYQLRRNDVLFRGGRRRWLILLSTPEVELGLFLERVEAAWSAANRNRADGPLPAIRYSIEGPWNAHEERDLILARVESCQQR